MNKLVILTFLLVCCLENNYAQDKKITIQSFEKVIISPHIQATFISGNEESVVIKSTDLPEEKIKIEVKGKTLRIYVEDAKFLTKSEKIKHNGWKQKRAIYKGTMAKVLITYKNLNKLSLRGEETIECKGLLNEKYLKLKIYGTSIVILNEVKLNKLKASIYGESNLQINSGSIKNQTYIIYGEGKVNSLGTDGITGKVTAFGESHFKINISNKIKMVAFGEAKLGYIGSPLINNWLNIGRVQINKIKK